MLLEVLGFLGIKEIGKSINTQVGKTNADKFGVYRDGNGSYRLIQNGRKVYDSFDKNGDAIYKYANNGLTAINMSLIEAEQNEEMAKKCGNRFYLRQRTSSLTPLGNKSIIRSNYNEERNWVTNPYLFYLTNHINFSSFSQNPKLPLTEKSLDSVRVNSVYTIIGFIYIGPTFEG